MSTIKQLVGIDAFYKKTDGTEMRHDEIYSKVVDAIGLDKLVPLMPASKSEIEFAIKSDEYLNNIPLRKWDARYIQMRPLFAEIGVTTISESETVCTLKQAARMWTQQ